jgi:hypothetical protein
VNFHQKSSELAARVSRVIGGVPTEVHTLPVGGQAIPSEEWRDRSSPIDLDPEFDQIALDLFAFQFEFNAPYRQFCQASGASPQRVEHWSQIPPIVTSAFKELDLSCLPTSERTAAFHSSGTTQHRPSRHFHNSGSLSIYSASVLTWFRPHLLADGPQTSPGAGLQLAILTPPPALVRHSSLVHMFETIRSHYGWPEAVFLGEVNSVGAWELDCPAATRGMERACDSGRPLCLLGTAFSFVHLLDHLAEHKTRFDLPLGSRVLETGGYKGRSRTLPKAELHAELVDRLGIPWSHIVSEYGMSELSSQAYDQSVPEQGVYAGLARVGAAAPPARPSAFPRSFRFPPWARVQLISPETGREVQEGEPGLVRVFDLANVFSVLAIQTEDLGVRRGDGFELLGRAALAEARGCSLMSV